MMMMTTMIDDLSTSHLYYSGAAVVKPVAIVNVSWSADHRVIDGATIGIIIQGNICW